MNIAQIVRCYVKLKNRGMECAAAAKMEELKCKLNHLNHLDAKKAGADLPSSHPSIKKCASFATAHFV